MEMPTDPEPGTTLRKKPVRRATAKQPEPEPKPRATRGKKAATASHAEAVNADVESEHEAAAIAKPTGRKTTRAKKDAVTIQHNEAEDLAQTRATGATKSTAAKGKKVIPVTREAPDLPQPEERANPTRRTRANATNASPLSPKKITQVSKGPTRSGKSGGQKPAPKKGNQLKTLQASRGAARKRTVSDENADLPNRSREVGVEEEEDDVVVLAVTPVKSSAAARESAHEDVAVESEASMSSRPTTPSDSPAPSFDRPEDDVAEVDNAAHEMAAPDWSESEGEAGASEDELCGPKTPMRRPSPGTEARYLASTQRTARRANEVLVNHTPLGRAASRTPHYDTHRTARLQSKGDSITDETRVSVLGLGGNSASVSHSLRAAEPVSDQEAEEMLEDESFAVDLQVDGSTAETSTLTDSEPVEPVELEDHDGEDIPEGPIEHDDPNDTILVDDEESDGTNARLEVEEAASFEPDDTVVITRHSGLEESSTTELDDFDNESAIHQATSPTPETIIWENIRQDVTIQVNFDAHLAEARMLPQPEMTERLSITADMLSSQLTADEDAMAGAELKPDESEFSMSLASEAFPDGEEAVDTTVNMSEFVDLSMISESTKIIDTADIVTTDDDVQQAAVEATTAPERKVEVQDEPEATKSVPEMPESAADNDMPHYALPTLAFDARRKSMPTISYRTPVKSGARPNTSDGASMPRIVNPFNDTWWARSQAVSRPTTPARARSSTVDGPSSAKTSSPRKSGPASHDPATPVTTPKQRYPKLPSRQDYHEHAKTVAAPNRFRTPIQISSRHPATATKPAVSTTPPRSASLRPRSAKAVKPNAVQSAKPETPVSKADEAKPDRLSTLPSTPSERFPRLAPRKDYNDHAKTAAAPSRFRTPTQTPPRRPATAQKPESLRKVALKAGTPLASHTPVKTPLKPPAMTPSLAPMTPHPAAPLTGVVAMVEVFTMEGASASAPFVALLHRLGAKTTKMWSERVTHVIFKDGSPTTLQRVRLHNKDAEDNGKSKRIHCVNSRWVSDCDAEGKRVDESDEAYAVDVAEIPRGGRRRRKSMEPSALLNIGGNVVRDRKGSLGRSSLGRSSLTYDSPAKQAEVVVQVTPKGGNPESEKENSGDEQSSPATPAWLHPEQLVQQTAPMNRVRKLHLTEGGEAKSRRLTFWNGAA